MRNAALLAVLLLTLSGCSQQEASSAPQISGETVLADGVQHVRLSWGKFNYEPAVITVKKDVPVRIEADMQRITGCFRSFVVPELGVSGQFTEENNAVEFTPAKSGEFAFTCTMGMGKGKLLVR